MNSLRITGRAVWWGLVALASPVASAQSALTLYGLVETGVRWTNHNGEQGATRTELNAGVWQGSRWGLLGKEALGDGLSAVFRAEAGFNADTGLPAQQGQAFGRQIYAGLEGPFGSLTAGRQYGASYSAFVSVDPIAAGNIGAVNPFSPLFGVRFDNSLKYSFSAGKFSATAMYVFGEQAGSDGRGRSIGASVRYSDGPWMVTTAYQEDEGTTGTRHRSAMVGGTYAFTRLKLFAGSAYSRFDAGFAPVPPLTNSLTAQGGRRDRLLMVGGRYSVTPAVEVIAAHYSNQVAGVPVDHRAGTSYAVLDYRFSRRTDAFLMVDHNRKSRGVGVAGQDRQSGVSLNLRHVF